MKLQNYLILPVLICFVSSLSAASMSMSSTSSASSVMACSQSSTESKREAESKTIAENVGWVCSRKIVKAGKWNERDGRTDLGMPLSPKGDLILRAALQDKHSFVGELFNAHTGTLRKQFTPHVADDLGIVVWSPSGRYVLDYQVGVQNSLRIWDVLAGTVSQLQCDSPREVFWDPKGRYVAVIGFVAIEIFDATTDAKIHSVGDVGLSPDSFTYRMHVVWNPSGTCVTIVLPLRERAREKGYLEAIAVYRVHNDNREQGGGGVIQRVILQEIERFAEGVTGVSWLDDVTLVLGDSHGLRVIDLRKDCERDHLHDFLYNFEPTQVIGERALSLLIQDYALLPKIVQLNHDGGSLRWCKIVCGQKTGNLVALSKINIETQVRQIVVFDVAAGKEISRIFSRMSFGLYPPRIHDFRDRNHPNPILPRSPGDTTIVPIDQWEEADCFFGADDSRLVVKDEWTGILRVYDMHNQGKMLFKIEPFEHQNPLICASPNGKFFACSTAFEVKIFDCCTGELISLAHLKDKLGGTFGWEDNKFLVLKPVLSWSADGNKLFVKALDELYVLEPQKQTALSLVAEPQSVVQMYRPYSSRFDHFWSWLKRPSMSRNALFFCLACVGVGGSYWWWKKYRLPLVV